MCLVATVFTLSCGKKEEEPSKLLINLGVKKTILIPGATQSCAAKESGEATDDISSLYVTYGRPEFTWQSDSTFRLIYVKLRFESGFFEGGSITCIVEPDELEAVFRGSKFSDLEFTSADKITGEPYPTAKASCPLKCGGVAVSDPKVAFVAAGELIVVGVETVGEEETPITTTVPIEVEHLSEQ